MMMRPPGAAGCLHWTIVLHGRMGPSKEAPAEWLRAPLLAIGRHHARSRHVIGGWWFSLRQVGPQAVYWDFDAALWGRALGVCMGQQDDRGSWMLEMCAYVCLCVRVCARLCCSVLRGSSGSLHPCVCACVP